MPEPFAQVANESERNTAGGYSENKTRDGNFAPSSRSSRRKEKSQVGREGMSLKGDDEDKSIPYIIPISHWQFDFQPRRRKAPRSSNGWMNNRNQIELCEVSNHLVSLALLLIAILCP